jgi:hypothetical protein
MLPLNPTVQTWSWELPKPNTNTNIIATDAKAGAAS